MEISFFPVPGINQFLHGWETMQQGETSFFQLSHAFEVACSCPPRWVLKDAFPTGLAGFAGKGLIQSGWLSETPKCVDDHAHYSVFLSLRAIYSTSGIYPSLGPTLPREKYWK